jgi:small subunit ribosomal protein S4
MGDPRKIRSRLEGPSHPWMKERIEQEKALVQEYGLKNKTEIWRQMSKLKGFARQAKRLVALRREPQSETEKIQLLTRLNKLGLLSKEAVLEDVLGLTIKDLLELRLQTLVCRKGFAKSMKQARQFITHGHVIVNGKKITAPSYLVPLNEVPTINFVQASALSNAEHPERKVEKTKIVKRKAVERPDMKRGYRKQDMRGRGKPARQQARQEKPKPKTEKKAE